MMFCSNVFVLVQIIAQTIAKTSWQKPVLFVHQVEQTESEQKHRNASHRKSRLASSLRTVL